MNATELLNVVRENKYFVSKDYTGAKTLIHAHPEVFTHIPSTLTGIDYAFEIADNRKNEGRKIHDAATIGAVRAAYKTLYECLSTIQYSYAPLKNNIKKRIEELHSSTQSSTETLGEVVRDIIQSVETELDEHTSSAEFISSEIELARLYILARLMERGQLGVAMVIGLVN